ncbi:MAG: c-type cytochrome, partial [Bryobacterales bacterium]|nr:c-type cytochrome [Bryobacterales bacterium]
MSVLKLCNWKLVLAAVALAGSGTAIFAGQQSRQQQPAGMGVFTAQQAAAGQTVYQTSCGTCHGADLAGIGNAAALAGGLFMGSWGNRTPSDLITFLEGAMPPGKPGSLGQPAYIDVTAFLLQSNGAQAGEQPLTMATKVLIRNVATGTVVGTQAQVDIDRRRGEQVPTPRGLTVTGRVKDFVPVTDAMLRNADPGDWLMIRRDYRASDYSPLNQITTQNVKNLQLQWVWAMNEG